MKNYLYAAVLCVAFPLGAIAAGPIDGEWVGQVPGENGPQKIVFVMKTDDERLSGSIVGNGLETSIEHGTVTGSNLTFSTTQRNDSAAIKLNCTGTANGDSIDLSCAIDGNADPTATLTFTVTKQSSRLWRLAHIRHQRPDLLLPFHGSCHSRDGDTLRLALPSAVFSQKGRKTYRRERRRAYCVAVYPAA
jgi:hypothetical protein